MSVKIYDGLRGVTHDAFQLGQEMRAVIEPIYYERFFNLFNEATRLNEHDKAALWSEVTCDAEIPEEWDLPINSNAHRRKRELHSLIKNFHEKDTYSFSEISIGYTVTILPNNSGGPPLALLFSEAKNVYIEALLKSGVVTDHGYWDNTDREDGLSASDWHKRKREWSIIFSSSPAEVGLSFESPSFMQVSLQRNK